MDIHEAYKTLMNERGDRLREYKLTSIHNVPLFNSYGFFFKHTYEKSILALVDKETNETGCIMDAITSGIINDKKTFIDVDINDFK